MLMIEYRKCLILTILCLFLIKIHHCIRELPVDDEKYKIIDNDPEYFWKNVTQELYKSYSNQNVLNEWLKIREKFSKSVSTKCLNVLTKIIRNPLEDEWSAKLVDSITFKPVGILSGSTTQLGDFDECLSVSGEFDKSEFVGKYCFATLNIPRNELFQKNFNFSYVQPQWMGDVIEKWYYNDNYYSVANALCFPSICKQDEIRDILLEYYPLLRKFDFKVEYCQSTEEPAKPDSRVWIAVYIFVIPTFFVVIGTIAELLQEKEHLTFLTSFSLIHNTKVLVKVTYDHHDSNESDHFLYIHGIRAIASFYTTFCHSFGLLLVPLYMRISVFARYPYDMQQITKHILAQPVFNGGGLIVQTFFFMSGMLLTYNALSDKLKIPFGPFVLLRWLRYTPPLIGALCMTLALQLFGNGPLFHQDILWPTFRRCYDSWWQNLLYINNFRDFDDHCMIQTWYLAAEMQLHIIAFVLLLAYLKSPKLSYLISIGLASFGCLAIVLIVGFKFTSMTLFHIFPFTQYSVDSNGARLLYFFPYMQFFAYFMGAILGQMLLEKRRINVSKFVETLLWIGTIFIFITCPLSTYTMVLKDIFRIENPSWGNGVHYMLHLAFWCMANFWFFYQCSTQPKSAISRFLSAKIFQPFSRLSFSVYLVHVMTIWYGVHQTRSTISFANTNELYKNISLTIIQSLFLAYLLYLTFEAPFVNWMKIVYKKEHDKHKQKINGHVKNDEKQNNEKESNQEVTEPQTEDSKKVQ